MKLRTAALCLAFAFNAAGQDLPAPTPPTEISVDVQCITLPQKLAGPIIRKLRSLKLPDHAEAMAALEKLLDNGSAKLAGWPTVTMLAGQKATYEEIEEMRYATEFEPAAVEVSLRDDDGTITRQPRSVQGLETEPTATAFDTRNLGITLEVDASSQGANHVIIVKFTAQHIRLKSIDRLVTQRENATTKTVTRITQEQPRFSTKKVSSELAIESGDHRLVGTFPLSDEADTLELFILGAEVLPKK